MTTSGRHIPAQHLQGSSLVDALLRNVWLNHGLALARLTSAQPCFARLTTAQLASFALLQHSSPHFSSAQLCLTSARFQHSFASVQLLNGSRSPGPQPRGFTSSWVRHLVPSDKAAAQLHDSSFFVTPLITKTDTDAGTSAITTLYPHTSTTAHCWIPGHVHQCTALHCLHTTFAPSFAPLTGGGVSWWTVLRPFVFIAFSVCN